MFGYFQTNLFFCKNLLWLLFGNCWKHFWLLLGNCWKQFGYFLATVGNSLATLWQLLETIWLLFGNCWKQIGYFLPTVGNNSATFWQLLETIWLFFIPPGHTESVDSSLHTILRSWVRIPCTNVCFYMYFSSVFVIVLRKGRKWWTKKRPGLAEEKSMSLSLLICVWISLSFSVALRIFLFL